MDGPHVACKVTFIDVLVWKLLLMIVIRLLQSRVALVASFLIRLLCLLDEGRLLHNLVVFVIGGFMPIFPQLVLPRFQPLYELLTKAFFCD